jgi:hypothetical protein
MRASPRRLFACCTLLLVAACGDRTPAVVGDLGAGKDRSVPLRDSDPPPPVPDRSTPDRSARDLALVPPDFGPPLPDAGFCGVVCKPGEVYLLSPCVATDKLFTCAPGCDPKLPASCASSPGTTCMQWGGTPCCVCSAVVPACVPQPGTGPIKGPLRFSPTSGIAGQKVALKVSGAPFYVGALFYNIRMGSEVKPEETGGECTIGASFTPPSPGLYTVEVSQYGGGAPWVLAGFYTASGGSIPQPTIQPGDFCKPNPAPGDPACASAPPYACSCIAGRCVCK